MNLSVIRSCLILLFIMLFSCEPWNLEKRPDHDYITFETTIQDNADKEAWGIMYDQGGYLVVGTTEETGSGNPDVYLVKINEDGIKLWSSSFGDSDDDQGTAIIKLAGDQGYALAGNKNVGGNDWQMYLIKTDLQGSKIWEEKYGWIKEDKAFSLIEQQNGGFFLLGHSATWESANLGIEAIIYETLADGTEQTRYNYGNPIGNGDNLDDYGHSIISAGDGNFIILATYEDKNYTGIFNVHLIKINGSTLNVIWNKTIIQNCHPINGSVISLSDGYTVLGALTANKLSLVKTNSEGVSQWERPYDNADCEKGASVCQTQDNGFLILSSGMTLIKTDASGLESERTDFDGETLGNHCVIQATDGGYVFTGVFENNSSGVNELKIVKMYPDIKNSAPEL
jgi:hypothetical protein